jgi:hypothetical protein
VVGLAGAVVEGAAAAAGVGEGGGGGGEGGGDAPILFFSRQIGINAGKPVPVRVGGRLTGKAAGFTIGAMDVLTEDEDAGVEQANFSIVRVKRDVFARSNVGVLATRRSGVGGADASTALGVDGAFLFLRDWELIGYYAQTDVAGASGDEMSYRGQLTYNGDRYGFQAGHLMVGDGFDPTVGFVRRRNFDATSANARFSPRFAGTGLVRRIVWQGNVDYLANRATDALESREIQGQMRVELNSNDNLMVQYSRQIDVLDEPFAIATGVVLPVGKYRFGGWNTSYMFGRSTGSRGGSESSTARSTTAIARR